MSLGNRFALWICCLPLTLLAVLGGALLYQDTQWRKAALLDRLTSAASLSAEALATADAAERAALRRRLLALEDVRQVALYDGAGRPLLPASQAPPFTPPPRHERRLATQGDIWHLSQPVDSAAGAPLGWLTLAIDTRGLTLSFYRQLASAGLGLLVLGLLLFALGTQRGRRLDARLRAATDALGQLTRGEPHTRLETTQGAPELRRLARRINALGDILRQSRDDLQGQIEQTTAELVESMETIEVKNIELDLAHRRALEASRVKSEFLANMSHEIRTPLNGIVGFCQLLGRTRLEARQREWLDQVQVACSSLLALVNDVLEFSRLEAGRLELDPGEVCLSDLVDEVLGLQAPLAHQKRLELLGLVYDDVPERLRGDALRLRQVLTNLVHNALKFTAQGEVIVRVLIDAPAASEGARLRINVSDTGIGLSPEQQQRLFQPFRQATPGHPRHYGGSGLGLAISRQLVEQMGGRISVESELGQGSTFTVSLPLECLDSADDAPRETGAEAFLHRLQITLYEPHPPTRFALFHLLTQWGAQVHEVASLDALPPATALLVAALPARLTDAEREVWHEQLANRSCPVLLLANTSPAELPPLPLGEGDDILHKPLARHRLAEALRRCIARPTPAVRPAPEGPTNAPYHLLIVDDHAGNRRLLRELLRHPALRVSEADSGEAALALAEHDRCDLVLMDIRMPGLDGVATTQALRRLSPAWQQCPIVAVTAHALDAERQRLLTAGLQDVLTKPVTHERLSALLQRYLGVTLADSRPLEAPTAPADTADDTDSETLATVDLALGTRLANGNAALAWELLDGLVHSLAASEAAIRTARRHADAEGMLDAVHALNGACRYCGTPELALLAETLETQLRARGLAASHALVDSLLTAMEHLRDWHRQAQALQPSSTTMASASPASSDNDR